MGLLKGSFKGLAPRVHSQQPFSQTMLIDAVDAIRKKPGDANAADCNMDKCMETHPSCHSGGHLIDIVTIVVFLAMAVMAETILQGQLWQICLAKARKSVKLEGPQTNLHLKMNFCLTFGIFQPMKNELDCRFSLRETSAI